MTKFYSTKNKALRITFEQAVRKGLADDGGLFMPERIDLLPKNFWNNFRTMSFRDIAFSVSSHFLQGAVPSPALYDIIEHSLSFDAPLVKVEEDIYSLELFHGPTLAFKDFGARFLAGVLGHFAKQSHDQITILVATSGDTGSAVAHGFYNLPSINVVVLYPSGKVSELQEKQFTTLGGNIVALEIDGTFDDCQRMVKEAFADREIQKRRTLSSANSINIARLLPQMFYYFRAVQQLSLNSNMPIVMSVPSGNFGNLMAGLMAKRMGLPIDTFIAATNINDVVPAYLKTKSFAARPSVSTLSNAMDVGNPSNFVRVLDLYAQDWEAIRKDVMGYAFTDDETLRAIQDVYKKDGYTLDPHGAVGYLGLMKYREQAGPFTGIFLETAHPGKFQEVVERALQSTIELPPALIQFVKRKKLSRAMKYDFEELKNYLLTGF